MQINLIDMDGNTHPYTMQNKEFNLNEIYERIRGEHQVLDENNFCKLCFAATLTPSDGQQPSYGSQAMVYLHYCDVGTDNHVHLPASDYIEYNTNYNTAINGAETDNVYFAEEIR